MELYLYIYFGRAKFKLNILNNITQKNRTSTYTHTYILYRHTVCNSERIHFNVNVFAFGNSKHT